MRVAVIWASWRRSAAAATKWRLSAGLVRAVDSVLRGVHRNAYALSRPPGHHCLPDMSMGFCLLANVTIAAESGPRPRHGLEHIAIVDWDVHHGNGTQAIFYERPDVLTLSLHQDGRLRSPGCGGIDDGGAGAGRGSTATFHCSRAAAMTPTVMPSNGWWCRSSTATGRN